ncbi:MNS3 [Symbiodinium sp. CCMP2456]|nr:MNS3 [Symbiodinium sp. CCMP2456]
MDHLICFLPGALALDVFHHAVRRLNGTAVQPHHLDRDRAMELTLAHKLMQSCVQMYFRTVTDLAPEITRFNGHGLEDDHGSMHNILRPETVESLFVLWRTTKLQVYRNWGQRLLSAFYRLKTSYGFASLHNVNQPSSKRDDMPSFFLAETLKYLFLLFSPDSVLPLDRFVLSTEAHPVPMMRAMSSLGVEWPCQAGLRTQAAQAPQLLGLWITAFLALPGAQSF